MFRNTKTELMAYLTNKELYESLFDGHPDAMFVMDHQGSVVDGNASLGLLSGYTCNELAEMTLTSFVPDEDSERIEHYFKNAIKGHTEKFESAFYHKHGNCIEIEMTIVPVRLKQEVIGAYGIIKDIAERKRLQRRLLETEQRYKSLTKYNPDGICEIDLEARFCYVNPAYERITGYSVQELTQLTPLDHFSFENTEWAKEQFKAAKAGAIVENLEFTIKHKNQQLVKVTGTTVPITIEGEIVGLFAILKDITQRVLSEDKLRLSQKRLSHAQQIARLGSWELDIQTNTSHWSDELFRIYGLEPSKDGKIGLATYFPFIHPQDKTKFLNSVKELAKGNPYDIEFRVVRRDGQERLVRSRRMITDEGQIIGILQDITEQKQTEELLLKSEKLAVTGEFAAGVGHEIRNPLTAIKGFLQLLQSKETNHHEYFKIMLSELNRINSIVTEFMYLAKPQASTQFEKIDIKSLIEDLIPILETQAIMNNVQIVTTIEPQIPSIYCEENRIKQVFINLIKNAIEAMPDGGKVQVRAAQKDEQIKISFIDQGCGIPQERLQKLGEPFYSTKESGTGLGLMVCHKIIQNHKGNIEISSQVGAGTTIDVTLPTSNNRKESR
ncbi:MAG: hypothetical protein JWN30_2690 [Bacilli bacterium]|nr:hypothetical protein [Bacilli bacterium]